LPEEQEKMANARVRFEIEYDNNMKKKSTSRLDDNASTHQRMKLKEKEMAGFASALKIDKYSEGDAFDLKLQEAKRQERMQERLEKEKEKLKVCSLIPLCLDKQYFNI
jgi:hypothetical protein